MRAVSALGRIAKGFGGGLLALSLFAAQASAQVNANEKDPAVWLKSVYDLYKRAETNDKLMRQANYRLIVRRSSKSLAALFRKNDECQKREQGVCAIDWDFVINGQDYQLSDVVIGAPVINGDKATVVATFKNMGGANRNTYYFVREGGAWKVEDVEMRDDKNKASRIAAILRTYKY